MLVHDKPKQEAKGADPKKLPEQTPSVPNETGIPDGIKAGFEELSGFSFDNVRVHYNSGKPAQLRALAYAQGNQVYIGPGQEKHLGHELGHIVQQQQGRVSPTTEIDGTKINDDIGLEWEADAMGQRAARYYPDAPGAYMKFVGVTRSNAVLQGRFGDVAQRIPVYWAADEHWNVKNPKPVTVDPQGIRWNRTGSENDRLYNTNEEAKAAAAAALGASFAKMASNADAQSMESPATMKAGFEAIRTSYGDAIEPDADQTAKTGAVNSATDTVDAFGVVTEKLHDAYAAIAGYEFHKKYQKGYKKKAQTAANTKKTAADAAVKAATGNAVDDATAMTAAAAAAAAAAITDSTDEGSALRLATNAAVAAGGSAVQSIAGHIAKKNASAVGTAAHGTVGKMIADAMLNDSEDRSNYEQAASPTHTGAAYQAGIGTYHYYRPTADTDGGTIKKGTPVIIKHTNDNTAKLSRKLNANSPVEYVPVAHWHAGIVKNDKTISDTGEQPDYVHASGIKHFFIKPPV